MPSKSVLFARTHPHERYSPSTPRLRRHARSTRPRLPWPRQQNRTRLSPRGSGRVYSGKRSLKSVTLPRAGRSRVAGAVRVPEPAVQIRRERRVASHKCTRYDAGFDSSSCHWRCRLATTSGSGYSSPENTRTTSGRSLIGGMPSEKDPSRSGQLRTSLRFVNPRARDI
jgi:hypothetical protein